jgi:crotonobetainyl-CoA:carnitine CoA-transferase CaiB-like acyl-CoA transferase
MVIELTSEDGRRARVMGNPLFLQESRGEKHSFPPAQGEHTTDVLSEVLGLARDEIAALIKAGAVMTHAQGIMSKATN